MSNASLKTEIENGTIDGDKISFIQTLERGGNSMSFVYKGKVSGDTIEFTRERQGGGGGRGSSFTAKRVK